MKTTKIRREDEDISDDFYRHRVWQMTLTGFTPSSSPVYSMYRAFVLLIIIGVQALSIYACILVPKASLIINTAHHTLLAWFVLFCLLSRIIFSRSLEETREMIKCGIYEYEKEDMGEDELALKRGIKMESRRKSSMMFYIGVAAYLSNMVYLPWSQYLFLDGEGGDESLYNPYMPHFFYTPFSTRTPLGYATAYLWDGLYYFFIYAIGVNMNAIYTSCTTQLKVQFQILNQSIRNIEKRALIKYKSIRAKEASLNRATLVEVIESNEFQLCLYSCLRENVKHHQALLSFNKNAQPYFGSMLLIDFSLAAIINAMTLYQISQKPMPHIMVNLVGTLIAEQIFTFLVCYYPEEILDRSKELFQTLYSISWIDYGKPFKQILHIMMSNTIKPLQIKTALLGIPGCLETFGDLFSGMYKLMTLVRQSDVLD